MCVAAERPHLRALQERVRERLNAALLAAGRRRAAVGGEEGGVDMV